MGWLPFPIPHETTSCLLCVLLPYTCTCDIICWKLTSKSASTWSFAWTSVQFEISFHYKDDCDSWLQCHKLTSERRGVIEATSKPCNLSLTLECFHMFQSLWLCSYINRINTEFFHQCYNFFIKQISLNQHVLEKYHFNIRFRQSGWSIWIVQPWNFIRLLIGCFNGTSTANRFHISITTSLYYYDTSKRIH